MPSGKRSSDFCTARLSAAKAHHAGVLHNDLTASVAALYRKETGKLVQAVPLTQPYLIERGLPCPVLFFWRSFLACA